MAQNGKPFPEYVGSRLVKAPGPGDIYPSVVGPDGRHMTYQGLLNLILANAGTGGGEGVTLEQVRDNLAVALVPGTGISITPDDANDTITITATVSGLTLEEVRDDLASVLTAGSNVTITPNDGANTITIAATTGGYTFQQDESAGAPTASAFKQSWFAPDTQFTYTWFDDGYGGTWLQSGTAGGSIESGIHVLAFGAVGDGVSDDTAAVQAAIDVAQATGATVHFGPGDFVVGALTTAQSFTQPSLVGAGMRATTITCSGAGPLLKMVGGSGALCGAVISDMTLTGSSATGIELDGVDGVTIERVRFDDLSIGLLFHNGASGAFTEFNVANRCVFESSTPTHIEYRRTSGSDSFHGSGFTECVFVQDAAASVPLIKIGANCSVYNAPWTGAFFAVATEPLISSAATSTADVYGTLTVEATADLGAVLADGTITVLRGGVVGVTGFSTGSLRMVSRATRNADGSTTWLEYGRSETPAVTTGANDLIELFAGTHLVNVYVEAANYIYDFTLIVYASRFDATGTATILSTNRAFNDAGYGAATFSFSSQHLVMTNASFPASGVTCVVTSTQIGGWPTYPLT